MSAQDPEDLEEAFRKRQAGARFTVTGQAPAWALKWPGGKIPKPDQPEADD